MLWKFFLWMSTRVKLSVLLVPQVAARVRFSISLPGLFRRHGDGFCSKAKKSREWSRAVVWSSKTMPCSPGWLSWKMSPLAHDSKGYQPSSDMNRPTAGLRWWVWKALKTLTRENSQAACSSGWPWAGCLPTNRMCCCVTSLLPPSMRWLGRSCNRSYYI